MELFFSAESVFDIIVKPFRIRERRSLPYDVDGGIREGSPLPYSVYKIKVQLVGEGVPDLPF